MFAFKSFALRLKLLEWEYSKVSLRLKIPFLRFKIEKVIGTSAFKDSDRIKMKKFVMWGREGKKELYSIVEHTYKPPFFYWKFPSLDQTIASLY